MASDTRRCAHCGLAHERAHAVCPFTGRPMADDAGSAGDGLVGAIIDGRYRVEAVIGRGGMGVVYRATNLRVDKPVAIKVLTSGSGPTAASRFSREARAAARVVHENVVGIYDVGVLADGAPYIALELLEGESLEARIAREGALDPAQAVNLVSQLLSGLEAVHESGAIHRDVKPANVFLARTSEGETVKLLDFGLSRSDEETRLTQPGEVLGTPSYLSPEQARGLPDLDARVDVWAAGVVFYEMLTARPPFDGGSLVETVTRLLTVDAPAPSSVRPDLPRQLDAVVALALEKERERRFATAAAMRVALARALRGVSLDTLVDRRPGIEDDDATLPVQPRHAAGARRGAELEHDLFESGDTQLGPGSDDD